LTPAQDSHSLIADYEQKRSGKWIGFFLLVVLLFALVVFSIMVGSYDISVLEVIKTLLGMMDGPAGIVVWDVRLPRIIAAIVSGCALGLSGMACQSLLRNPIASPFTLGISQGAAFGAAFSIVVLGVGGLSVSGLRTESSMSFFIESITTITIFAFLGAMGATLIILALARMRQMTPEAIILSGVALSSLFTSGTILIQYFATDVEIATVVFWTFGDVARSSWQEIGLLTAVVVVLTGYYLTQGWSLNAMATGEESARSLGVNVERSRLIGMSIAAFAAALTTAFHGVIAFLGLLAPHIGRRLVGADYRMLIPYSCLIGALLLLAADTIGRLLVGSGSLPVGVLTSFMGAPLFLYLLIKGLKR